jgi:predicted MFS family arabinose efflux permease
MASVKTFTLWFPPERLAVMNGRILLIGGLGALAATAPAQLLLQYFSWRHLFVAAGVVAAIAVALLIWIAPDDRAKTTKQPLGQQFRGFGTVFSSRLFWRVAVVSMLTQATFMGIQSLWAGPWLIDVAGLSRTAAANHLLIMSIAMVSGSLAFGHLGSRFSRAGQVPLLPFMAGVLSFSAVQFLLALGWSAHPLTLWVLFGFFGAAGSLAFAIVPRYFDSALTGRVITALNVLVFGFAFACQWGVGLIINLWPQLDGHYHPNGYRAGFAVCLALQLAALGWFWVEGARRRR